MKTIGEKRVRIDFNVTGDDSITNIKKRSAELIDLIHASNMTGDDSNLSENVEESWRLKEIAMQDVENGCMWAVKALTVNK